MILYPSVDELLKQVDSRYSLIMLASKRAHEIDKYRTDKDRAQNSDKPVDLEQDKPLLLNRYGMALEEIEAGLVSIDENPSTPDED